MDKEFGRTTHIWPQTFFALSLLLGSALMCPSDENSRKKVQNVAVVSTASSLTRASEAKWTRRRRHSCRWPNSYQGSEATHHRARLRVGASHLQAVLLGAVTASHRDCGVRSPTG